MSLTLYFQFCRETLPTPYPLTMESKSQNSTFSEHGHVAYQIKDNHECSNMAANILPADPPTPTLGIGSVDQNITFFQNMVMLHIKLKRITNAATWKQIFSLQTPIPQLPSPGNGVSSSNLTFLEHGHVAYQIKWNHEVHQNGNNYLA